MLSISKDVDEKKRALLEKIQQNMETGMQLYSGLFLQETYYSCL